MFTPELSTFEDILIINREIDRCFSVLGQKSERTSIDMDVIYYRSRIRSLREERIKLINSLGWIKVDFENLKEEATKPNIKKRSFGIINE